MDNICRTTEELLCDFVKRQRLPMKGATIYVALSGGADSMALLRLLLALAPQYQLTLRACHVNHCLRGATADADEAFVRAACENLRVPLTVFHAAQSGVTPPKNAGETWARSLRYAYFETLRSAENTFVATAHTLNDQAETLLFRLARGTGVHGAAGILPKRGRYLRPLLCLTRAQVEAYCVAVGQAFVTDETNVVQTYARNRLRAQALPALCYANEAAVQHLGQFCEKMTKIDAYFSRLAAQLLRQAAGELPCGAQATDGAPTRTAPQGYALAALQAADALVLSAAMHQLISPLRDAEQKYIEALCALVHAGTGAVQLTDAARVIAKEGWLYVEMFPTASVKTGEMVEYYPVECGEYRFSGGYQVKLERFSNEIMEKIHLVHKKDLKNYADYDKIVSSLTLRCRRQGDVFSPSGRGITKTVKKLHNELGVPTAQRGRVPLLADGHTVVWLWGQGFAEGFAPSEDTKEILKITEVKNMEETHNEHEHG